MRRAGPTASGLLGGSATTGISFQVIVLAEILGADARLERRLLWVVDVNGAAARRRTWQSILGPPARAVLENTLGCGPVLRTG